MTSKLQEAANNVVSNCIKVAPDEEVAIICEQDKLVIAEKLTCALLEKKAHPIVLPIFRQSRELLRQYKRSLIVPKSVGALLNCVSVIVTLIDKHDKEFKFRRDIIKYIRNNKCRVAHMPGLTKEQFIKYLRGDFEQVNKKGMKLKAKFKKNIGKKLRITSKAGTDLTVVISSNIRLSSGVIDKAGMLDNLPAGEFYFVPEDGSANGQVVIDVSVPGTTLKRKNGSIKIPINDGNARIDAIKDPKNLITKQLCEDGADVLCEVGIGLNDQISEPTGVVLIDEKMDGTVHVAFGDNTFFGGSNKSSIHMDMVMQSPSVFLEDEEIMINGDLIL